MALIPVALVFSPEPAEGQVNFPPVPELKVCNAHAYGLDVTWDNGWWFMTDWWEGTFTGRAVCDERTGHVLEVTLFARGGTSDLGTDGCLDTHECLAKTKDDPKARVKNVENEWHCFDGAVKAEWTNGARDQNPFDNLKEECVRGR